MKTENGQITLGDKTFEATKKDFDSYEVETGSITFDDKMFESSKVEGIDNARS